MTRRRLRVTATRGGELAGSMARSMSASGLVLGAGAVLAAGYLLSGSTRAVVRGAKSARPAGAAD